MEKKVEKIELTILMPCLNEEKTIGICIEKAKKFLEDNNINGEILIVNNGSVDDSRNIAEKMGVRIIDVEEKGYGTSLINGSKCANGKYVIMGDCDDSYNFLELMPFLEMLRNGYDFVIGNRYKGKMKKGSMKLLHKYIGTPLISLFGRIRYKVNIGDFNCGLRGYDTEKMNNLNCSCKGMEYASEMIIKAKMGGLKIIEIPINFYKDSRGKKSHLNTVKDGIKHFKIVFGYKLIDIE